MKTLSLRFVGLHKPEHHMFSTEFRDLVIKFGADALNIKNLFEDYLIHYDMNVETLSKVTKSAFTAKIQDEDRRRDELLRGLVSTNNGNLRHFDPRIKASAKKLRILLSAQGNLVRKSLQKQTSGLIKLVEEFNGEYAHDVLVTNLTEWVENLRISNETLFQLMKDRKKETVVRKPAVKAKDVRKHLERGYRAIIYRIEAMIELGAGEIHREFIRNLNVIIAKYNTVIAQRAGRRRAANGKQQAPIAGDCEGCAPVENG